MATTHAAGTGSELSGGELLSRGFKIATETLVAPGSSLILDGKLVPGAVHVLGGLAAKALLGPIGWILIAANSYSKSVTGQYLPHHFAPSEVKKALTA